VFKNPRDTTQSVHLAPEVYPENISSFHQTYLEVCKDSHTCLFPGELQKCLHLFEVMNRLQSQLHFLHVLKDAKPQARRALLACAGDDLIKDIVECAINTRNGNHRINKEEKNKLSKYNNRLRALINPKFSFKSERKILIKKVGFIFPLITRNLSCLIGTLISNI